MDIDEYYENHYEGVVNSGFVGRFSSYYHFLMERDFKDKKFGNILELGSGKGQHLQFLRCEYDEYLQTDIRVSKSVRTDSSTNSKWAIADAQNLFNFRDGQFQRTIATCLLAHLTDPENALREWRRVTSKCGGVVSIYVPCEPSFLLRLAQKLSTRRKATKLGIDYSSMHYREHRNHYFFIKALIFDVFKEDDIQVIGFPTRFLPFDLKLYEIYQIRLKGVE
jgi:phosphatidylethanolamine/phosphatidyl-N-methylethanolamine N-methyltransferase